MTQPEDKEQKAAAPSAMKRVLPLAVILIGAGLVAWGVGWHRIAVEAPVEAQESASGEGVADTFGADAPQVESTTEAADPFALPPGVAGQEAPDPFALPPGVETAVEESEESPTTEVTETVLLSEKDVILETTRGGLELVEPGRIRKTYSGAPPQVCPT